MPSINIRPIQAKDAEDLYRIRTMDGVCEQLLALPSARLSDTEEFISTLSKDDHIFVAELNDSKHQGLVVGSAGLVVESSLKLRHSARVGLMIHADYHKMGIGRNLMNHLLELADNWLNLVRLELDVFADNINAIKLYQSLGFVIEANRKYAAIKNGQYADLLLMARYNLKS